MAKILYFSYGYGPHDHRFLTALAGTEHEVFFVRLSGGGRQTEDRPLPEKINQIHWAGGRGEFHWRDLPGLTLDFRRLTRNLQPDLIHAGPIQTCGLIATLAGAGPRLIMSWGFDLLQDADRNRWWRWATRFVLHRATCFTCDCEAARQKAIQFGISRDRAVVFPWGVDLKQFFPLKNNPGSRLFTLLCNRSWEPRYGVDVLAKAFTLVVASRSDVHLLLLAGGSQEEAIRQILHPGRLDDRVTYAGQVSQRELPAYYHMADLYISPAHVDGSSVSLMEALACGLPCLVSNIPANREWVTDGVNGWLFQDGDANALAARILLIMNSLESLSKVGEAARRVAEEKADWSKNFQKLLKAYELVLR